MVVFRGPCIEEFQLFYYVLCPIGFVWCLAEKSKNKYPFLFCRKVHTLSIPKNLELRVGLYHSIFWLCLPHFHPKQLPNLTFSTSKLVPNNQPPIKVPSFRHLFISSPLWIGRLSVCNVTWTNTFILSNKEVCGIFLNNMMFNIVSYFWINYLKFPI